MGQAGPEAFGPLLKRLRLAISLSQEELAERADVSARAVSDLERGVNRQPRRDTAHLLLDALGPPASDRARYLAAAGLPVPDEPGGAPIGEARRLDAALPRLIGRDGELTELRMLLLDLATRLVTLTGPGGVGKTRLAIAAAAAVETDFAQGAALVSLAAVDDTAAVPATIARSLGVRETGREGPLAAVIDQLRNRDLLLVLDNVEQVASAAPLFADLLAGCAGLRILTTSRTPLRLRIERDVVVEPLTPPPPGVSVDPVDLARSPAVALFVERAGAVRPGFALTAANASAIAEICRRLDGLPLALELAAARVNVLAPEAIRDRLDHALDLLTAGPRDLPPRQQTLRATIAWSYDLLHPEHQALFRRLAVFAGGISIESAEALRREMRDERRENDALSLVSRLSSLDSISALVDHHLLRVVGGDETSRFDLLETIRAFALEELERAGELAAARQRHAEIFLDLAETALGEFGGAGQAIWLDRVEREHDNLRAALRRLLETGDAGRTVRLAAALWWFWWVRGHLSEGRQWLERALALPGEAPVAARTRALTGAGTIAELQGDLAGARGLHERALRLARAAGDERGLSRSLVSLGAIAYMEGDFAAAIALWEEDLAICRANGEELGVAHALFSLAKVTMTRGDLDGAATLYADSLARLRARGDARGIAAVQTDLAVLAFAAGDLAKARARSEEAMAIWQDLGDQQGTARVLTNLADVDLVEGRYDDAAARYRQALEISAKIGDRWGEAAVAIGRGRLAVRRGEADRAVDLILAGLRGFHQLHDRVEVAGALEAMAGAVLALGQADLAIKLFAAGDELRTRLGVRMPAAFLPEIGRGLGEALAAVGEPHFNVAWEIGAAWSRDETLQTVYDLFA